MNIQEFMKNPVGKGNAAVNMKLLTAALDAKYAKWVESLQHPEIHVYTNSTKTKYYIWMVAPTETERDNSYDIVIEFYDDEKHHKHEPGLSKYDIKIFSNVPSFAYTYAYVYNKNDLIREELKGKLPKNFYKDKPKVRNQQGIVVYDKYTYYVMKYLTTSGYLNKSALVVKATVIDKKKSFFTRIRTFGKIMDEYDEAAQKLQAKKRRTKSNKDTKKAHTTGKSSAVHTISKTKSNISKVSGIVKKSGGGSSNVRVIRKR